MTGGGVKEGRRISDRYRVESRLGAGGMATVYLATDTILEREVAVKVLADHLSDDEKFVARFRREALAVAKLIHPNIVQVYDTGVDHGQHYIVMEYVEGKTAAQLLRRSGRLEPDAATSIAMQASLGLDHAHKRGIVHRDVKPGNLMLVEETSEGGMVCKITDFGIARTTEQTHITQVGSVVGTAAYLSPEQARGEDATPSSDVYSLGVVLYQLLTGLLPYEGSSLSELAIRQQNEDPLPPREHNSEIPDPVSRVVLRALALEPEHRYGTARELYGSLRAALDGSLEEIHAGAPTRVISDTGETNVMATPPRRAAPPTPAPPSRRQPARKRRTAGRRLLRGVGTFLLLALIAGAVALIVIASSGGTQGVEVPDLIEVTRDTAQDQIQALRDLIERNASS